jgi:hypothetical protein
VQAIVGFDEPSGGARQSWAGSGRGHPSGSPVRRCHVPGRGLGRPRGKGYIARGGLFSEAVQRLRSPGVGDARPPPSDPGWHPPSAHGHQRGTGEGTCRNIRTAVAGIASGSCRQACGNTSHNFASLMQQTSHRPGRVICCMPGFTFRRRLNLAGALRTRQQNRGKREMTELRGSDQTGRRSSASYSLSNAWDNARQRLAMLEQYLAGQCPARRGFCCSKRRLSDG